MPRKSHSVAARYAERSKKKKKRDPGATLQQRQTYFVPREPAKPQPAPSLTPEEPVKHPLSARRVFPEYRYVVAELKLVGLLAGAMFVILIVLGFTLR